MAKRIQKPRKTHSGEWLYCNFSARPEEIAKWKALAGVDRRSLSFWIRDVLNRHVEIQERVAAGADYENSQGKNSAVHVEAVSPNRS
jgi:hypothetical protein